MAGAVVFTKADALKAFLQVHLTEESSKLLVINTHKGQYRFKRMRFGVKMSQDVFQMKMDIIMEKCPGVISIHDDIVIYGTSDQDHDANLINLLNVAQLEGLVLNSKKLELKRPKLSFFGSWVQCRWHAPLSQEDTKHYWDDTSHWQTAAGQLHRNGHLHGELRTTPLPSHWATEGNAQARRRVSLGWGKQCKFPENQGPHSQDSKPAAQVTTTEWNQSQYRLMPPKGDLELV